MGTENPKFNPEEYKAQRQSQLAEARAHYEKVKATYKGKPLFDNWNWEERFKETGQSLNTNLTEPLLDPYDPNYFLKELQKQFPEIKS